MDGPIEPTLKSGDVIIHRIELRPPLFSVAIVVDEGDATGTNHQIVGSIGEAEALASYLVLRGGRVYMRADDAWVEVQRAEPQA